MGAAPLPWRQPTNWDQDLGPREKREGERQTDRGGHRGCVIGIKIETGRGTIRAEARDTHRERERHWKSHSGETNGERSRDTKG